MNRRQREFREKFKQYAGGYSPEDVEQFIKRKELEHGACYWDSFYLEPDPLDAAVEEFRRDPERQSP